MLGKGFQSKWRSHGSFQRGCPWPSLHSYVLEATEEEKTKEEKQEAKKGQGGGQFGLNRPLQFWLLAKFPTFILHPLGFYIFYFSAYLYKNILNINIPRD